MALTEPVPVRLDRLAELLGLELRGDPLVAISGIAPLERAEACHLAFFQDPRLASLLARSAAGAVILPQEAAGAFSGNCLVSPNPYASFARAMQLFHPPEVPDCGYRSPQAEIAPDAEIDPGARVEAFVRVDSGARIGAGVWLESGTVVGRHACIGSGSHLYPGVKVYARSIIGRNCIVHANAVIGSDGFGFAPESGSYVKIPHAGRTILGNNVEIGANTCIDRGVLDDTLIGEGVKIDNLVQVGHNVHIGPHTVIAGQTGIAGSTWIGAHCRIGGQVGFAGHLRIADGTVIAGQSAITHDLRQAGVYSGVIPAQEARKWRRMVARLNGLDRMAQRLQRCEHLAQFPPPADEESEN